ncbi:MAG: hypothetical protein BJ554DRAFT_4010 [Olpidium bornovanus]|uniref:RRM domain-containing protein n=1 Tax=Olpidium bornovanus TaxID=278681 RepID=A0A8H7ZNR6_9FUNG|nr:MAG: hypothetical protein BJ554DRAFT_4010 [Olpidium bornovanus]
MNNFDLGGLQLHVILAVLGGGMGEGMKALQRVPPLPGVGNASTPGGPSGLTAGASPFFARCSFSRPSASNREPDDSSVLGALAAHTTAARIASDLANKGQIPSVNETVAREENLSISSSQRYAIMQALARNESVSAAATGSAPAAPPAAFSSILLVRNAVSAADVDDELREEFAEECGKFGRVTRVHVHVDKSSTGEGLSEEDGRKQGDGDVRIFIQFTLPEGSRWYKRAAASLHGHVARAHLHDFPG